MKRLISLRKKLFVTQRNLARAIGVSRQVVGHWENGRCVPTGHNLRFLALALGVKENTVKKWFTD